MINLKRYIIFLLVLCSAIGYAQSFSSPTTIPANGNVTVNGVTITTTSTGDVNNSISASPQTPCLPKVSSPVLTTVPGQLRVGSSSGTPSASTAWSVTLNFSSPVNNVVFSITTVDLAENFIFNSNGGPVSLSHNSCYMNVAGNQAVTNGVSGGSVSDVTGGFFQANSPFPYTQLTINGNGGGFGSVILLSGGSIQPLAQPCTKTANIPPNGTFTVNGVTVNSASTGAVSDYWGTYSVCGSSSSITMDQYPLWVGSGTTTANSSPWQTTLTFSKPVNNIVVLLSSTGSVHNEIFRFTSNNGTISIADNGSCFSTISGNTIISGQGSSSTNTGGGGVFTLSSPTPFTQLVMSGDGGDNGSMIAICESSIKESCIGTVDSDGDGKPDECDLDDDNDGILDSNECASSNRITNGVFPTSGSSIPGWTATGSFALNSKGLQFDNDNTTTTVNQTVSGVFNGSKINLNNVRWLTTNNAAATGRLITEILYNGTVYATINTGVGVAGSIPTVTGNNGAYTNISTLPSIASNGVYSTPSNIVITLPFSLPSSGVFQIRFTPGSTNSDDLSIESVQLISCSDFDGDGIPNQLDLDSDGDGCSDAREGAGNFNPTTTASGTLSSQTPNINFGVTVDSSGVPTTVGASGQALGQSQDIIKNDCLDSDNDGVPNWQDLDDDNDGILDTDEGFCLSTPLLIASKTFSATGSGVAGRPNITFSAPTTGTGKRLMFLTLTLERDHTPTPYGDNWESTLPATDNFANAPVVTFGSNNMFPSSYSTSLKSSPSINHSDATISVTQYVYRLWDSQISAGLNSIDLSNFQLPKNAGDEWHAEILVFDHVNNLEYIGTQASSLATNSLSISGNMLASSQPAGTIEQNNVLLAFGATSAQSGMSINSGWNAITTNSVANTNGTYATDPNKSSDVLPENDGISVFTATKTGVTGNQTATFSFNKSMATAIIYRLIPPPCNLRDTDGDGIPDYLDLDSDADGCPDAKEGAGNFNPTATASGTLSTQTPNINFGTTVDANGVPTEVGASGQAIGQSIDASKNDCLDTDGDGYPDWQDLDDDNDGILDCVENGLNTTLDKIFKANNNATYIASPSSGPAHQYRLTNGGSQNGQIWSNGKIDFTKSFSLPMKALLSGADGIAIVFHNSPAGQLAGGTNGQGLGARGIANGIALELDTFENSCLNDPNNGGNCDPSLDHGSIRTTAGWVGTGKLAGDTQLGDGTVDDGLWHNVVINWNASTRNLSYTFDGVAVTNYTFPTTGANAIETILGGNSAYFGFTASTGGAGNNNSIGFDDLCALPLTLDFDNDGISNHLDLDSDGDGCPDAIEGAGNFTASQLTSASGTLTSQSPNQNFGTTVDANGVPTVVGTSGQALGQSQDASKNDCLDSDNDGVPNWQDLDDDNDGILDTVEMCKSAISTDFFGGQTYTVTIVSSANVVPTTATITPAITDYFIGWHYGNVTAAVGKEMSINFSNPVYFASDNVDFSLGGLDNGSSFGNFFVVYEDGVRLSNLDFSLTNITGNITTSTINGAKAFNSGAGPNSTGSLTLNGIDRTKRIIKMGYTVHALNGSSSTSENIRPRIQIDCDMDGDGIPNQLDLDSDGDACPDAIEGAGNFTASQLTSASGTLTSQTPNQNFGTTVDANGVPTVVGASGQAIGQSQDIIKNDCLDSDNDGVPNWQDLDDDNDGILDTNECVLTNLVNNGNFDTNFTSSWTNDGGWTYNATGKYVENTLFLGGSFGNFTQLLSNLPPSTIPLTFTLGAKDGGANATGLLEVFLGGTLYATVNNSTATTNNITLTLSNGATSNFTPFTATSTTTYTNQTFTINIPYTGPKSAALNFKMGASQSDDWSLDNISINTCDTDADGIPNNLDLDSDNDGCPDAIEGGGNFTASQLTTASGTIAAQTPNQNFGIVVDANGVPTIVGAAGQTVGQSLDATKNDCLDSDNDGYPNWLDLDDDNDGILDTDECPNVSIISNGTFTSPVTEWTLGTGWDVSTGIARNQDDNVNSNLSQTLNNLNQTNGTVKLSFTLGAQDGFNNAGQTASLSIILNGTTYATFNNGTARAIGTNNVTQTLFSGATSTFTPFSTAISPGFTTQNVTITIPYTGPDSAVLTFNHSSGFDDWSIDNVLIDTSECDLDGDGIPNQLDLDSDDDGCPDALEGAGNFTASQLTNASGAIAAQTPNQNFGVDVDANGVPTIVTGGQSLGDSQNGTISPCCSNPPNLSPATDFTKTGISNLAGFANGWPGNVPNGFLAIESKNKGFVITRVANTSAIVTPVEGMLIYDLSANCVKLYNGTSWKCLEKDCTGN